ncbi:MAG: efflux RND transporter periplasmic adaptor subunit [candidate division Zixibacteria bacterium]|nr:efflux RND transporter periplasmic adaptor subunit [candidate division Zixibacteria bacterium]
MKKLLVGIVFVAIVVAGYLYWQKRNGDNPGQVSYETVRVERGNIEIKVLSTGTIQPYTRVEVSSSVSGRIDRVEVEEGDIVKEGDILAWISSEDRIALLDAARSALESAQKTNDPEAIKEAQMAYEIANKAYKPVPLTNSIAGEVINRSCEPGQNVSTQSILFVISDRLVAKVEVDEADIGKIKLGQETWIVLDAFPDERLKGKVTKISREGRLVSDVVIYDVMVDPLKVPRHWASGMTANVEFMVEKKDSILLIPKSTVTEMKGENFVMVLEDQPTPRRIETGITDGRVLEVTKGLKEGDTVILGGIENNSPQGDPGRDLRRMMRGIR